MLFKTKPEDVKLTAPGKIEATGLYSELAYLVSEVRLTDFATKNIYAREYNP